MKTIGALLLSVALSRSVFGQTEFVFRNYHPSGVDAPIFDVTGNRLFGAHYVAVLYGGPARESLTIGQAGTADMPPESLTAVFNGQPGYFARGGHVSVPSVTTGLAWLQVRAWDMRLGSTYDEVALLGLGGYGASPLFQARGGDPLGSIPPQPLLGLQSFSLVPEPGAWALLTLGTGIVFWNCRRRFR